MEFDIPKSTIPFPVFEDSRDDRFEIDFPARLLDALGVQELEYDKGMTFQFRNIPGSSIWKLRLFSR